MSKTEKSWKETSLETLGGQRKQVHKSDQTFYQFDRFERIIERLDEFSHGCQECVDLQKEITEYLPEVSSMIQSGAKGKRRYENLQEKQLKHLETGHGIYPYSYFISKYTLIGMLAGMLAGFIFASIFTEFFHVIWISLMSAGMIISYILGSRKDMKLRRLNKVI